MKRKIDVFIPIANGDQMSLPGHSWRFIFRHPDHRQPLHFEIISFNQKNSLCSGRTENCTEMKYLECQMEEIARN